jgi:hypothetical protein
MTQGKHWQDSANALLGVWLMFSPLILGYQNDVSAVGNSLLVGVLLLATALGAIFFPRVWEEWTETVLGLWLAVSPWVVGFASQPAKASALVTGLIVLTLALWALQDYGSAASESSAH